VKTFAEIIIILFLGFFEKLIRLIDKNYRIDMHGFE